MGRPKYYKLNLKQQIHSLQFKNKYFHLKSINLSRYGLCQAEAELLAETANHYYQNYLIDIPENYFYISLFRKNDSNKKTNFESIPKKIVKIPAFCHYELEIYESYGLKAFQNYRLLNILDSISFQDAQIDINLLAKIINIAPKSIRERLKPFFDIGIKIPLMFLSNKFSTNLLLFRYSKALHDFFIAEKNETEILAQFIISKKEWTNLLFHFFQYSYGDLSLSPFQEPLLKEIDSLKEKIINSSQYELYSKLYPPINIKPSDCNDHKDIFCNLLKNHFGFSNALIYDYLHFLEQESSILNNRKKGEIVYYAVNEKVSSGTPLSNSDFLPIKLKIFSQDDLYPDSPYNTNIRKWNKIQRYSIQTQNQNANLSQYDLAYLLAVSIGVIKQLMKNNKSVVIPTRGNIHDIGPGISHSERIIKLYLEGYTETEIKLKTGHSYDSIESYLKNFTKVVGLTDLGLNFTQIRMTANVSFSLLKKFQDLYKSYNTKEYSWIFAKIRKNFSSNNSIKKKDFSGFKTYE